MKQKRGSIRTALLFLLPCLLLYTIFLFLPLLQSASYSLTKWNGVGEPLFIGIQNYQNLLADSDYWTSFSNTMILVGLSVLIQIPGGLLFAYLLYIRIRGTKFFRTVFFLPVVIAPVAIGLMFTLFYNSEIGIFNRILEAVGLGQFQTNWLSNIKTLKYAVMAPQIWQYIGLYITIFLGALQSVPEELMESAKIDGAGKWKAFRYVILPEISGFVTICLILCITGSLKCFDHAWIMTQGGPGVRSSYLGVTMYKTAFVNSDFGKGSAITITIVAVSLLFSLLINKISDRLRP